MPQHPTPARDRRDLEVTARLATAADGYIVEAQGLVVLEGDLTVAQWTAIGLALVQRGDATQWALGDWIALATGAYGETYTLAMRVTGYSYDTVSQLLVTARAWPKAQRLPTLSWSHHRLLAGVAEEERGPWLKKAVREVWSAQTLQERLVAHRNTTRTPAAKAKVARGRPTAKTHVTCPACGHTFVLRGNRVTDGGKS